MKRIVFLCFRKYVLVFILFCNVFYIYGQSSEMKQISKEAKSNLEAVMQLKIKGNLPDLFHLKKMGSMAEKIINFKKEVKKQYPKINLSIYLTPEAAIYKYYSGHVYIDSPEDVNSISDSISYFCSHNGLEFKCLNDIVIISKAKRDKENIKGIFRLEEKKTLKDIKQKTPKVFWITEEFGKKFEAQCDGIKFHQAKYLRKYLDNKIKLKSTCCIIYPEMVGDFPAPVRDEVISYCEKNGIDLYFIFHSGYRKSFYYKYEK